MTRTHSNKGKVFLVGAGPGDPDLLTRKAADLLQNCDALVYDRLVSPEILSLCAPAAERIYVGKREKKHTTRQPDINVILAKLANEGKRVVRLKGGDPYLFGRGAEEALHLIEHGIPVEVVPGVTAGIAASAYAGIPVTHRNHASAVAFVTGHEDPAKPESTLDWASLSKVGTLCIYMASKNLGRIASALSRHLPETTPAAVIEWGTTSRQRSVSGTLKDIESIVQREGLRAPTLTVIGDVVALRSKLNLFEKRPLFGKKILMTRSLTQAGELATALQDLGAHTLLFPTIRIAPASDASALIKAASRLAEYDWIILTSVNGVDALFEALHAQGSDTRAFGKAKVAAIGSATSRKLAEHGIRPDLIPQKSVAESIVEALKEAGVFGSPNSKPSFLLPRADIARSVLPDLLKSNGGRVEDVVAYENVLETEGQEEALRHLMEGTVDAVTFTSSSTARNFTKILGEEKLKKVLDSKRLKCFSIGPVTSQTMRDLNIPVHGEAEPHEIPGLVRVILDTL